MTTMPEPWRTWAIQVRLSSYHKIADAAELSSATIYKAINGKTDTVKPETLAGLAKALRRSESEIAEALGIAAQTTSPYSPPPEADFLDTRERKAVDEFIRVIVRARNAGTTAESGSVRLTPVPEAMPESGSGGDLLDSLPIVDSAYDPLRHAAMFPEPYEQEEEYWDGC
ncbi:helix-turn-helix domain-containing protein [Trueperella sp. LYQ141]|uniref:helix-turn-helix domain-containing protein n=1 Tax=Trueperella sp. LYQ141 TaxID=3391058 RepID=UPI0039830D39